MAEESATNLRKKDTKLSSVGILVIAIAIVAIVAAIAWAFMTYPDLLANVLYALLIIVGAIIVIAVVIAIAMMFLAVPMYAMKGEQYQDGVSYDMDDVQSVKETNSEDKKP
jgi:uncharacterized membrane protein